MEDASADSAMSAMDGTQLDGRTIKVNEAQERPRTGGGGGRDRGGFGGGGPRGPRQGGEQLVTTGANRALFTDVLK